MPKRQLIQTALVTHRHGTNFYVARSKAGIIAQLADYARQWWNEAGITDAALVNEDGYPKPGLSDQEITDAYFAVMNERETEYYELGEAVLED